MVEGVHQPSVFLSVQLALGQTLIKDLAGVVVVVMVNRVVVSGERYDGPNEQTPKGDHGDTHEGDLPESPMTTVSEHHVKTSFGEERLHVVAFRLKDRTRHH
jgi:hypothetical protein